MSEAGADQRVALDEIAMVVSYIVTQGGMAWATSGITNGPRATPIEPAELAHLIQYVGKLARLEPEALAAARRRRPTPAEQALEAPPEIAITVIRQMEQGEPDEIRKGALRYAIEAMTGKTFDAREFSKQ